MKNLVKIFSVLMIMVGTFAFGQSKLPKGVSEQQISEMKSLFEVATDNFVESVSVLYKDGMSLQDFEKVTMVNENTSNEGKRLIEKAYGYLSHTIKKDRSYGKEMAEVYLLREEIKERNPKADLTLAIFGNSENALAKTDLFSKKRKCKWYQIGCHLSNFFDWLEGHPNIIKFAGIILPIIF